MIPQRNISLLANRLAKEGGRRFQESVLERDYCLAWFLAALAESDLKPVLGFKGGTALKRCYFEDYRFSEDLDFTLTEPITFEELVKRLESVYAAVYNASGIVFAFDREDRQTHENSYTLNRSDVNNWVIVRAKRLSPHLYPIRLLHVVLCEVVGLNHHQNVKMRMS